MKILHQPQLETLHKKEQKIDAGGLISLPEKKQMYKISNLEISKLFLNYVVIIIQHSLRSIPAEAIDECRQDQGVLDWMSTGR